MSIDENIIDYQFDENEADVVFNRPLFAQGWVICLFWAALLAIVALVSGFDNSYSGVILGLSVFFIVITPLKHATCVKKLAIANGVVYVFTNDKFKPSKQIHLDNMTAVVEASEIFFIQKAKYFGGITLRSIYWIGQWDQMRNTFSNGASYVKRAPTNFSDEVPGLSMTTFRTASKGSRGGGSTFFKAFLIIYELLLVPYISICKALFYNK